MNDQELPGFRFHPTEEELLHFYLKHMVFGKKLQYDHIIGVLNIYQYAPWDLPELAKIGEREWYFFVPRDRKHGTGGRPNRTTEHGFWKATGTDRKIFSSSTPKKMIGLRKTLVFYKGRAPRGCKTDWVMNEYRLPDTCSSKDIVLCKIYRKATTMKVLEQRAAMDEMVKTVVNANLDQSNPMTFPPLMENICFNSQHTLDLTVINSESQVVFGFKKEDEAVQDKDKLSEITSKSSSCMLRLPSGDEILGELQVPKFNMDWSQVPLWTPILSPWLDNFTPYAMF